MALTSQQYAELQGMCVPLAITQSKSDSQSFQSKKKIYLGYWFSELKSRIFGGMGVRLAASSSHTNDQGSSSLKSGNIQVSPIYYIFKIHSISKSKALQYF